MLVQYLTQCRFHDSFFILLSQLQTDSAKQSETMIALAATDEQQSKQLQDFEALLEAMQGACQLQTRASLIG